MVDILVEHHPEFAKREKKAKLMREADDEILQKAIEPFESSEESDDDEEFDSWWKFDDENMYFMLGTKYKNIYLKH